MMNIDPLKYIDTAPKTPEYDLKNRDEAKLKSVAEEFESLFLGMLFKSMRQSVDESGLMEGGHGGDLFKSLLDDEYAKLTSKTGSTGIAEMISKDMLQSMRLSEMDMQQKKGEKAYQIGGKSVE